jgi:5-formyltetrahydrofolate cyclo-ligase
MSDISVQKKAIRQQIAQQKANFSPKFIGQSSLSIWSKVEMETVFLKAQRVLIYWSLPDEVSTHNFILKWAEKKTFLLPVMKQNTLVLKPFSGINNLEVKNNFHVSEPIGDEFDAWDLIDLALIPGVAFDAKGNRLGRGKGFYDRILNRLNAIKIGICFDFQVIEMVPVDQLDLPMDMIISESFQYQKFPNSRIES